MAPSKKTVRTTGIYEETVHSSGSNPDDMFRLLQDIAKARSIAHHIETLEPKAIDLLRNHGIMIGKPIDGHRNVEVPPVGSNDALRLPPEVFDAKQVLYWIDEINVAISKNDVRFAALAGFSLGQVTERWGVRPFEKAVIRGRQASERGRKAAEKRFGRTEVCHEQIRRKYRELRPRCDTHNQACVEVRDALQGTEFGRALSTIKRVCPLKQLND